MENKWTLLVTLLVGFIVGRKWPQIAKAVKSPIEAVKKAIVKKPVKG